MPHLVQAAPAQAGHLHGRQEVEGLEPGAVDDRIRVAGGAVPGDHTVGDDALDRVRDQIDVRAGQRRIPVVGEQHPLAAHDVVGDTLGAQPRVGDLGVELAAPQLHRSREELGRQDEAAGEQLAVEEDAQPVRLAHAEEPLPAFPESGPLAIRDEIGLGFVEFSGETVVGVFACLVIELNLSPPSRRGFARLRLIGSSCGGIY